MLCEYRSDDLDGLNFMKAQYEKIFATERKDATVEVKLVGDRPCSANVDPDALAALRDLCAEATAAVMGEKPAPGSGSTDANIPHSLGIPAITMAVWIGAGAHTREEYIEKDSLKPGLEIGLLAALALA